MEIIMNKYLVLIIFAFSFFLSKAYLDTQEQKNSSEGSRLNVDDQSLISKNVYMNGRYDYIDRTDYKRDYEENEKEENKSIQKEEKEEEEEEKEGTKKSKEMNKDKQKNRSWWIFGD
jgi:hypothetical protein